MQTAKKPGKILGKVTAPSGVLILIDFGLMDLWTHDKPPLVPAGVLSEEALAAANNGVDFGIEGIDALLAGKKFDKQPHPLFLYDIPRHTVDEIKEGFASLIKKENLNARLVELDQRVCPRKRVDQAVEHGIGAAEVFLHGIHAIAISGLPPNQPLSIEGRPMEDGPFAKHWRDISLIIKPEAVVAQSIKIGHVAVDMGRLMFCDLDAMGEWQHQDTIDGLADLVFWGKDAQRLATKFGAMHIDGSIFGVINKPIDELAALAFQVQKHLELHHLVAAIDFRPHSDHWRMLKAVAECETESGDIELGKSRCCGFMTSWGDGFFPIYLELDEKAAPIKLRIELGTEETIRGMHMVNRFA
jgi:hypothetical protein